VATALEHVLFFEALGRELRDGVHASVTYEFVAVLATRSGAARTAHFTADRGSSAARRQASN
jgi:hypothetical protein